MRLPMKPSQTPAHRHLAQFLRQLEAGGHRVGTTLVGTTISSSFMMWAGEKKCRPSTSCGREMLAAISFDVEVRGVGGQHRAGFGRRG